jgi:hypothetical protein
LHEARPASPDEEHDDASDRLSIVDMVEFADGNSVAGTPKSSDISSPMDGVQDMSCAISSLTSAAPTAIESSASASTSSSSSSVPVPTEPTPQVVASHDNDGPSESVVTEAQARAEVPPENNPSIDTDSIMTSQSPQSTVAATTQID